MKKNLLLVTVLFCLIQEQAYSQCAFTSPTVVQTNAVTAGSNCQLTFNVSFDIDYNGGFKQMFIHVWENTEYNPWHIPANNLYATNGSQPEFNDGDSDPLNILSNSIFTLPIDIDGTNQTITILGSYSPDPDAPVATGSITSTLLSGTNYQIDISVTITVPSASLTFGCSNLNYFNGDAWGSQAAGPNPSVHCAQQDLTLPVQMVSFNAVRNGQNVNLEWQTASEENNLGFDIERITGNGSWQKVGFVPSQGKGGSSHSILNYQYTDYNNLTRGVSQYRLKQIDIDRRSEYSSIKLVNGLDQKSKTLVFPNPSNDGKVNVMFDEENMTRNVSVLDINGRIMKQWKGMTGNNIQMDNLPAGIYTLRIINTKTNKQTVEKFIVSKR